MPMINRPCDCCGEKGKEVYEHYKVQTGTTMKLKRHELIPNRFVPADMEYLCNDCYKKETGIINATISET